MPKLATQILIPTITTPFYSFTVFPSGTPYSNSPNPLDPFPVAPILLPLPCSLSPYFFLSLMQPSFSILFLALPFPSSHSPSSSFALFHKLSPFPLLNLATSALFL
ncbi:hypothetical protein ACH5RR_008085 [Cinchona calisaya]|uniref:Uncharacterized protein n=1 Tax=Cinchona calisaya TaxID=153742 RepID=A0ABD3AB29_9GENT